MMPTDSHSKGVTGAPAAARHVTSLDFEIGEVVHLLMRRNGVTQAELARELGIDATLLGRKLRGKRKWYVSEVDRVASVLGVTFEQLRGREPLPAPVQS